MAGNADLLRRKPRVAIDIEGFVAGVYEAEMGLINEDRHESHTFSEMTEYPRRDGRIFGLSYDEHTAYRRRTWEERRSAIPRYVDEPVLAAAARDWDAYWVTAGGDDGIMVHINAWLGESYPNVALPTIRVPKGSDKSVLDFDMFLDDAPRLARRIAELNKANDLLRRPSGTPGAQKRMVIPKWPYTPTDIAGIAPSGVLQVAQSPLESFSVAREMLRDVGRAVELTVPRTKSRVI